MTAAMTRSRHPSAGDLLRRLDGELDEARTERLSAHLGRCGSCRSRMSALEASSREARRYLGSLPAPPEVSDVRRARARAALRGAEERHQGVVRLRRLWAVAAAMAGVLIVSLSADPVRAWLVQFLPAGAADAASAGAPEIVLPVAVVGASGSVVSFQPAGEYFELSVEARQGEGEVFLQALPITRATAQITDAGNESLMVLPTGLRIENSADSRASYRVTLPPSVDAVLVSVAGDEPRLVDVPEEVDGWRITIPLER